MNNSIVGIYTNGLSGRNQTIDDFEWHPGGDVDLTIDTDHAGLLEELTLHTASVDANGVDLMHHAYSLHDVVVGTAEDLWSIKVTLDVLNGNIDAVYVHGVQCRFLPLHFPGVDVPFGIFAR